MTKAQERRDRAAAKRRDLYLMGEAFVRGHVTYEPALPCKHHPDAARYVSNRACVECRRVARVNNADRKLRRELGDLY